MSSVTIVDGGFCSGRQLAEAVAERTGYTLIDDKWLEETAERHSTSVKKLSRALAWSRPFFDGFTHELHKSIVYLKAALADYASRDNIVFRGPAAHLIPPEITHILRVCVIGDRDYRIKRAVESRDIEPKEAEALIDKADKEMADWTRQIRGVGPWEPSLYDIRIPIHSAGIDGAVEIISDALTQDALRPTNRSVQAVVDFLLATNVNLKLVEHGYHDCDVTSHNGSITAVIRRKPASWGQLGRTLHALRIEQLEDDVKRVASAVEGVKEVEVQPGAWHKRTPKTLLVDDEQEYVVTLSERLGMRNISSGIAYDGYEALEVVETESPDVMVLDLRMPGIDGIEVLRRVRRDHPHIQVIVVTGHGSEKDERAVRELGAFEYLEKPVDIKVLAETIQRASDHAKTIEASQTGETDDTSEPTSPNDD